LVPSIAVVAAIPGLDCTARARGHAIVAGLASRGV
jgi:hypothetical protein